MPEEGWADTILEGVVGTYPDRIDSRTPMHPQNQVRAIGGGAASGPKNDDDRFALGRPHDIQCFNCGLVETLVVGVLEGKERI